MNDSPTALLKNAEMEWSGLKIKLLEENICPETLEAILDFSSSLMKRYEHFRNYGVSEICVEMAVTYSIADSARSLANKYEKIIRMGESAHLN